MKLFWPQHPMMFNYGKKGRESYPQFHSPIMLESSLLFFPACIYIIAITGAHFKKHFEWPFPISQETELISHTYLKQKPWKEQSSLCDYFPVTRFWLLYLLKGSTLTVLIQIRASSWQAQMPRLCFMDNGLFMTCGEGSVNAMLLDNYGNLS